MIKTRLSSLFLFAIIALFPLRADDKYETLCHYLNQFSRPFSLCELSPSGLQPYAFRIAASYPSEIVFHKEGQGFLELCKYKSALKNIVLLTRPLNTERLQLLTECEHFDISLLLNFFDETAHQSIEELELVLHLAWLNFIEIKSWVASPWREKAIQFLESKGAKRIYQSEESSLYLYVQTSAALKRKYWIRQPLPPLYPLIVSYDKKWLIKPIGEEFGGDIKVPWISGINLVTYKMMEGKYPSKELLTKWFTDLKKVETSDWVMHNMIVTGSALHFIDTLDPRLTEPKKEPNGDYCSPCRFRNYFIILDSEDLPTYEKWMRRLDKDVWMRDEREIDKLP